MSRNIKIWGTEYPIENLETRELEYLNNLPSTLPNIDWVWREMDRVWDSYSLNNRCALSDQNIGAFYSHPVWLMNGIFTSLDKESKNHREAIAEYIKGKSYKDVADYGGGSGCLARTIHLKSDSRVDIIEPFQSPFFVGLNSKGYERVQFLKEWNGTKYNCIISQDVLEHVENPLNLAHEMAKNLKPNGILIFANCFRPYIKCHLPKSFYLRYTFKYAMSFLGLKKTDTLDEASHVEIYQLNGDLKPWRLKLMIPVLKLLGLGANSLKSILS